MIPIAFAYGGWQTSSFVAGEMRDPRRDLSRGLVLGVARRHRSLSCSEFRLRSRAWRRSNSPPLRTPASAVMRAALGERGAQWIAVGIAISTLGFLSQGILTAPRVYYAMARDGLFFQSVGKFSPRTGAPVVAIVLQGIAATLIAVSGRYEQILNYVVSVDFISFGLTAASLFVFAPKTRARGTYLTPGIRTRLLSSFLCAAIVAITIATYPSNSAFGVPSYWPAFPYIYTGSAARRSLDLHCLASCFCTLSLDVSFAVMAKWRIAETRRFFLGGGGFSRPRKDS